MCTSPHEQCSTGLPEEGPSHLHSASRDKREERSQTAHAQHMHSTCIAHAQPMGNKAT